MGEKKRGCLEKSRSVKIFIRGSRSSLSMVEFQQTSKAFAADDWTIARTPI
jgi:hypothetical protein